MAKRSLKLGPGLLVAAAFIGPGTVTTASRAGAGFGVALLWTLVFAVFSTMILQEMAARLGLVSRQGLGEAVRGTFKHPASRMGACLLVIAAIGFGNAAYQTGNVTGAAIGLEAVFGMPIRVWTVAVGFAAFALLAGGVYRHIERVLVGLVVLMSLMFVATAVLVRPDPAEVLRGLFAPSLPTGSLTTILALIGTTVVPYNLFLHASVVQERWSASLSTDQALAESRWDTSLSILLGGLITLAIMAAAAAAFYPGGEIHTAADMARQLEPLLGGPAAKICFAVGLFAAGMTSAMTAPLATAYAVSGVMGWPIDLKARRFQAIWLAVLAIGTVLAATLQRSPTETILIAQVANGLLLPLVAVFLLVVVNRSELLGAYQNGPLANALGALMVLITIGLGLYAILRQTRLID